MFEYSEWVTRCRICLTSAWKERVCLSIGVLFGSCVAEGRPARRGRGERWWRGAPFSSRPAPRIRQSANRHRHPLRHAAARGRVASGRGRGRRRRPVRPQVPRRRPGREGADRRAPRRRDRAGARPAGSRDRLHRARHRPGAHRARPRDPGPDPRQRRPQPRPRLPLRRPRLRPAGRPDRCRARLAHRLARRLRHQPRPDRAQHQHAGLASQALAHRPRRRALLPPCRARRSGRGAEPVSAGPRPCAAAARRAASPRSTRRWRRG